MHQLLKKFLTEWILGTDFLQETILIVEYSYAIDGISIGTLVSICSSYARLGMQSQQQVIRSVKITCFDTEY